MRKLKLIVICMVYSLCMSAQTVLNTGYLQLNLNRNLMAGYICSLDSASDTIYVHSGAGYKSSTSLWDAVVGRWGQSDGIGKMTTLSDSTFTICWDLTKTASNYYSVPATADLDSGPMPVGHTIFNIGVVFRDKGPFPLNSQGQPVLNNNLKGAGPDVDGRGQCSDIWLIGVNSDSIGQQTQPVQVIEEDFIAPIPAVTVTWVNSCGTTGVNDISSQLFDYIKVSPNPFRDKVNIEFNMIPDVTKVFAQVYDVMGRRVADFSPGIRGGYNSFTWDGTGADGISLPSGTYVIKVTNGSRVETAKLIKL